MKHFRLRPVIGHFDIYSVHLIDALIQSDSFREHAGIQTPILNHRVVQRAFNISHVSGFGLRLSPVVLLLVVSFLFYHHRPVKRLRIVIRKWIVYWKLEPLCWKRLKITIPALTHTYTKSSRLLKMIEYILEVSNNNVSAL